MPGPQGAPSRASSKSQERRRRPSATTGSELARTASACRARIWRHSDAAGPTKSPVARISVAVPSRSGRAGRRCALQPRPPAPRPPDTPSSVRARCAQLADEVQSRREPSHRGRLQLGGRLTRAVVLSIRNRIAIHRKDLDNRLGTIGIGDFIRAWPPPWLRVARRWAPPLCPTQFR